MAIYKFEHTKVDGRRFIEYRSQPFPVNHEFTYKTLLRPDNWLEPNLRYNAMRDEWVAISASRNNRPFLPPKEYCPLCPQTLQDFPTEAGGNYEWLVFENMYPALSHEIGTCEVILYSEVHEATLGTLNTPQLLGLLQVWQDRSACLGKQGYKQIFIFENKGAEIGVTLHHPHGQLYAFGHVPPFILKEQQAAKKHYNETHSCMVCDLTSTELNLKDTKQQRIVLESESILAYVPFAARYPYEIHVTTKEHRALFEHLSAAELNDLAFVLKEIVRKYNALFQFEMPYIMCHHQCSHAHPDDPSYHWHLEFYPPYRSKDKLKFLAGVESGTGFFINDTLPEEKAAELRLL